MTSNVAPEKKGVLVVIIGFAGSGKTTLAKGIFEAIYKRESDKQAILLDADEIRNFFVLNRLGNSVEDRWKALERVSFTTSILSKTNSIAILTGIFPHMEHRAYLRRSVKDIVFVYLKTSLETCKKRHPGDLYQKADKKEITNVVGFDIDYEIPKTDEIDLQIDTANKTVEDSVQEVMNYLEKGNFLA